LKSFDTEKDLVCEYSLRQDLIMILKRTNMRKVTLTILALSILIVSSAISDIRTANAQNPNCVYRLDGILFGGNGVCPFQGVPTILSQVNGNFSLSKDYMVQTDVGVYTKMVLGGPPCDHCYDINITAACRYDTNGNFIPHLTDAQKAVVLDLKNNFSVPICPFTGKPEVPETISPGVHRVHEATLSWGGTVNMTALPATQTKSNSSAFVSTQRINQTVANMTQNSNEIKDLVGISQITRPNATMLHNMNMSGIHIPSWFKKITEWTIDGQISQNDFVNALKFLSEKGIIK
jgi:hypothetical protein